MCELDGLKNIENLKRYLEEAEMIKTGMKLRKLPCQVDN